MRKNIVAGGMSTSKKGIRFEMEKPIVFYLRAPLKSCLETFKVFILAKFDKILT